MVLYRLLSNMKNLKHPGYLGTSLGKRRQLLWPPIIPYHAIPYHTNTISYHAKPYNTMPNHTLPYHSISYHAKPYLTNGKLPCHNISYHATPYLTMPYHTIALLWPPTASGLKPAHFPSCQSPIVPIPVPFHLYQPAISISIPSILYQPTKYQQTSTERMINLHSGPR